LRAFASLAGIDDLNSLLTLPSFARQRGHFSRSIPMAGL
jgi:hypothetical protein